MKWQYAQDCGDSDYWAIYTKDGRKIALVFSLEDAKHIVNLNNSKEGECPIMTKNIAQVLHN